ncbi:MAG: potassium transporter, partial [Neisseria sp.]|nr:potassium transporter [Neisseria sp.]
AEEAVSDTKETSLALAAYALLGAGISYQNVHQIIMNIRRSRYAMLEDLFVGRDDEAGFYDERNSISRYAFALPEAAHAVGRRIDELPLQHLNVKLLSVRRRTHQIQQFDADFCLEGDDVLVIAGHKEKIISFENWSLQGGA